ncbi:MAG: hypothetical protein WAQ28_04595 [Bacteroidia bacterium]
MVNYKKIVPAVCLLLATVQLTAGPDSSFVSNFKSSAQSSLLLFTAGYRMPVNKATVINSGHGIYLEAGINPGYFASKKLVVGFFAGWAWKDRLWATSFNSDFVKGYRSSIDVESHFSTLDSAVIYASADAFETKKGTSVPLPGCEMSSFHNQSFYYGTLLRLPYRYLPALKLYMGLTSSFLQGPGDMVTKRKDFNVLQLKRAMYGCELILFRGFQRTSSGNEKYPLQNNIGMLSLYFESHDFYNARLDFYDGEQSTIIALKRFLPASFLEKYRTENMWGIKLSFAVM